MTKIKICGITNIEDALMVTELGADAVGFVFAPSRRKVNPQTAKEIIESIPSFITTVGVFMNSDIEEVNQITDITKIDVIQLHGDEPSEYCGKIKRRVIKRVSIHESDTSEMIISRMEQYKVSAYLLDPGAGDGKAFDWKKAIGIDYPLIIAGGLTPENVKGVIELLRPYGVDVSSGVEKSFGVKDKEKVNEFVKEVRSVDYGNYRLST